MTPNTKAEQFKSLGDTMRPSLCIHPNGTCTIQLNSALSMSNSSPTPRSPRNHPPVEAVWITSSVVHFDLADGRSIAVPLSFYPPLQTATTLVRNQYEIHGGTVYWAALGFKLTSMDLLQGRRKTRRTGQK
jgi:hypothetical protein